jgi:hypothetical protein
MGITKISEKNLLHTTQSFTYFIILQSCILTCQKELEEFIGPFRCTLPSTNHSLPSPNSDYREVRKKKMMEYQPDQKDN